MKKITLLFLFVFASVFNVQAQFPEGFETTVPPAGWASFRGANGLGTVYDWTASTTVFASGAQSAFVRYENVTGGLAEDWLVTSQFTPTAATNILSFQQRQTFTADYGTQYTIRVSTASQTTIADFVVVDTQTEADLGLTFAPRFVDLSAYNDTPIYVAFVMVQDDGDNWYVDDVDLIADASAPGCSSNPTPADAATGVAIPGGALTFSWDAPTTGDAPTGYEFFFGETSGALTSLGSTSTTSIDIINLDYSTTYYWMVVPSNAGGSATGCSEWSFTTEASPGYCLAATYGQYPAAAFTPSTCDGTTSNNITTVAWAGEYTVVNVTSGQTYQFTSSVTTDFVTISDVDGTTPLLYGTTPVTWTSSIDGQVRFYTHISDQCESEDVSRTRAVLCGASLGIGEQSINSFTYFPNPVKSTLNLNAQSNIQNVSVYNMLGQEVLRTSPNSLNSEVNMASLQTGAYFVKVSINDATETIRVIKQ